VNDPSLYHEAKALVGSARRSWLLGVYKGVSGLWPFGRGRRRPCAGVRRSGSRPSREPGRASACVSPAAAYHSAAHDRLVPALRDAVPATGQIEARDQPDLPVRPMPTRLRSQCGQRRLPRSGDQPESEDDDDVFTFDVAPEPAGAPEPDDTPMAAPRAARRTVHRR